MCGAHTLLAIPKSFPLWYNTVILTQEVHPDCTHET